jgi:hypothetical protein
LRTEKYRLRYTHLFERKIKGLRKNKALLGELGKKIEKLQSNPFFGNPTCIELKLGA